MSSSDRYGEAQETRRPSLKVSMPRSVPSVPGQSSGIDSTTDTPIVSNTENSSPYGEDDHSSPQLHIDTTREVNDESYELNPPTAGLDTGGLGQKYWEEEANSSFYFLNPSVPSPDDADNQFERRFNETEEILNGAPGTEEILGPIEEPVLDFGGLFADEPSLAPNLDPTLPPSYETPHHLSNDGLRSTYAYSNAELDASNPALVGQPSGTMHVPESNPRYSQSALRLRPTRAPETIQDMGLAQHQISYYNTNPSHDYGARNVRADRPLAGSNVGVGGSGHAHLHPPSNQHLGLQKRRSISDASIFLQHEHQYLNNPGYEEQPYSYGYGFTGNDENDETPAFNTRYSQTQLTDPDEYASRGWRHGKQEHRGSPHAQQNVTDADQQGILYGGTTEMLPSQSRPAHMAHVRDTTGLPQQQLSEGDTIFNSIDDAKKWRQRHLVSSNKNDPTIPRTTAQQKDVVRRLVEAIYDTDEAMQSTYVKYFTDQKYSQAHIESTCWMALDACITRQVKGPLQTEDERGPFKAKIVDYNTFAERMDIVIRALRTQKSICKQLMEPYHLYHFIDDPLAKIKRTENNKALNDRKAEQIAAGKALRGDTGRSRARGGKQKPLDEEEFDNNPYGVADAIAGLNSASQELRMASATVSSTHSTPATSAASSTRKRRFGSSNSNIDSTLGAEDSGPSSKKARTGPLSSTLARHGQQQQSYQPHLLGNSADQSHVAGYGQNQPFGQPNASGYGNPSTGGIHGAPYFTQRPNVQRRPGQPYPEIEGYHTPSVGFGLSSTYDESSTVSRGTGHVQQSTRALHHNPTTTRPTVSSGLSHPPAYATGNPYPLSHESTRGQRKRQAESEDEGSDFESSQTKRKRRRNA